MHPSGVRWCRRKPVVSCFIVLMVTLHVVVTTRVSLKSRQQQRGAYVHQRPSVASNSTSSSSSSSYLDAMELEQQQEMALEDDNSQDDEQSEETEDESSFSSASSSTSSSSSTAAVTGRRTATNRQQRLSPTSAATTTTSTTTNNNNNNNNNNHNHHHHQQHNNYNYNNNAYNCSRCRMLEETINVTKEAIKMQILSKLGLKVAPNITKRALPRIPPLDHLLDLYGMQSDMASGHTPFKPGPVYEEAEDDYHAKMEKIISFAQQPPTNWGLPSSMAIQYFKFSHAVTVNKVVRANLWVYLNPSRQLPEPYIWLHVYKVWRSETNVSHILQDHAVSAKVAIKPRKGSWFTLDIRKTVGEWFRTPHANLGIVIQAFDNEGRQLVATDRIPGADPSLLPFLEVYVMDESKRRTKRMIGLNCEEKSQEVRCCRYPLKVDFEEFGWDWIIAPKTYEANYCSGECPFVFLQKYPHTHLVQQANPSGSAGPCCAPRKMSPISMLYFDHEYNIIYGLLPGMVVDRCGCS